MPHCGVFCARPLSPLLAYQNSSSLSARAANHVHIMPHYMLSLIAIAVGVLPHHSNERLQCRFFCCMCHNTKGHAGCYTFHSFVSVHHQTRLACTVFNSIFAVTMICAAATARAQDLFLQQCCTEMVYILHCTCCP